MTNQANAGIHTTTVVDYAKYTRDLITDIAQYNQGGTIQDFPELIMTTPKERCTFYVDSMGFALSAEGGKPHQQKFKRGERYIPMGTYALGGAWTDETLEDADAEELDAWKAEALRADQKLLTKLLFATTIGGDASGYKGGFWNGSTTEWNGTTNADPNDKPQQWKNNTFLTTHNHYAITGSATLQLSDFGTIKSQILEHGYGEGNKLVMFVSEATAKAIADMAGWTTAMTKVNIIESTAAFGVRSKVDTINGFTIVVDDWVPDSYLYGQALGGKAIAMRVPVKGGGLKFFTGPYTEYPMKESYFKRRAGMAVIARGSGAVYEMDTASYSTKYADYTFEKA